MREQNPAEYLIYMWYLESLVRAMPRQEDFDSFSVCGRGVFVFCRRRVAEIRK